MLSHFKTITNMCLNVLITCHLPFQTRTCICRRLFQKQSFYIIPVGDRLIGAKTIEKPTSGRPKDGCGCLIEDSRLIGVLFTVFYWQKFKNFRESWSLKGLTIFQAVHGRDDGLLQTVFSSWTLNITTFKLHDCVHTWPQNQCQYFFPYYLLNNSCFRIKRSYWAQS